MKTKTTKTQQRAVADDSGDDGDDGDGDGDDDEDDEEKGRKKPASKPKTQSPAQPKPKTKPVKSKRVYEVWPGNNRFPCKGTCVSGADWSTFAVTVFLIAVPASLFLAFP